MEMIVVLTICSVFSLTIAAPSGQRTITHKQICPSRRAMKEVDFDQELLDVDEVRDDIDTICRNGEVDNDDKIFEESAEVFWVNSVPKGSQKF